MKKALLLKFYLVYIGFVGLALISLPGCTEKIQPTDVDEQKPIITAKNLVLDSRLISANTSFGFNLFHQLLKDGHGKNLFISPSSISMALAMTYNGSGGETKEAMAGAMGIEGRSLEEVNGFNLALKAALENPDPKVELSIANSLWAREEVPFKQDFLKRNRDYYDAKVKNLDFNDPKAPDIINKWVGKKTKGKIDKIIDNRIDPLTIMFLINATYFKGDWSIKFDKTLTKKDDFTLLNGMKKKLPMMSQSGKYMYYKGEKFQAVSLPYGEGRMSMYAFLPDRDSSLKEFYQGLKAESWERWLSRLQDMEGDIVLPRFKLEYKIVLNDALKALGMEVAFDVVRANFENIINIPPVAYIKEVLHKTFVKVNEEGTEAAAVTKVEISIESVKPTPLRFSMIVDRPFFFAIRDNKTGTVLFMGSIVEPETE